ncbi:MAG TPA: hypothetical protein VN258_04245 [Mobilitalea sp.]|nr:hypothetical protein [Mobilitalea sp.]
MRKVVVVLLVDQRLMQRVMGVLQEVGTLMLVEPTLKHPEIIRLK